MTPLGHGALVAYAPSEDRSAMVAVVTSEDGASTPTALPFVARDETEPWSAPALTGAGDHGYLAWVVGDPETRDSRVLGAPIDRALRPLEPVRELARETGFVAVGVGRRGSHDRLRAATAALERPGARGAPSWVGRCTHLRHCLRGRPRDARPLADAGGPRAAPRRVPPLRRHYDNVTRVGDPPSRIHGRFVYWPRR